LFSPLYPPEPTLEHQFQMECNSFTVVCPTGWSEVIFSDDEEDPVPTWEKSGGVGAVKFTVAHYARGKPPNIGRDFLLGQLNKFPEVFDLRWKIPCGAL
jgi:hypothetical protein